MHPRKLLLACACAFVLAASAETARAGDHDAENNPFASTLVLTPGTMLQIAGDRAPEMFFTPGARLHLAVNQDAYLFVSYDALLNTNERVYRGDAWTIGGGGVTGKQEHAAGSVRVGLRFLRLEPIHEAGGIKHRRALGVLVVVSYDRILREHFTFGAEGALGGIGVRKIPDMEGGPTSEIFGTCQFLVRAGLLF